MILCCSREVFPFHSAQERASTFQRWSCTRIVRCICCFCRSVGCSDVRDRRRFVWNGIWGYVASRRVASCPVLPAPRPRLSAIFVMLAIASPFAWSWLQCCKHRAPSTRTFSTPLRSHCRQRFLSAVGVLPCID